ncbi:hypothetical protein N431DRAFT_481485 [Stipitochalara longipes BDJ]|nr:hypothetical protein N431DRAFT_481485 [Stipitochalara longipes BDJ]
MSRNPSPRPNQNNKTWGLSVPGRPNTPSEGFAQAYHRFGPAASQKTRKFDNGTCLTFGPNDPVDEFDADAGHPFLNQIALVDKAFRDIKVTRQRYEGESRVQTRMNAEEEQGGDANSEDTMIPDPFDDFRTQTLDPATLSKVTLKSGTYTQVPSRFATTSNLISVYSVANKSDVPGALHMGSSVDTRFGNAGPSRMADELGTLEQHRRREHARYRLRKHNEQLDYEEIRRTYVPRSGRQVVSTTGLIRANKPLVNRQRLAQQAMKNSAAQGTAALLSEQSNSTNLKGKQAATASNVAQPAELEATNIAMKGTSQGMNKLEATANPDPKKILVGSASFAAQSARFDGFPPEIQNIHRPIHPGQQYTNRLFAEQSALLERQRLLARNSLITAQQSNGSGEPAGDQATGALAARVAQINPRSASVPGEFIDGYRSVENVHSFHPPQYQREFFTDDHILGGMPMLNPGLRLPDIGEMLAGQGLGGQDIMHGNNAAGVHNYGLRGLMTQDPPGDQLFFHAPFSSREMLARADTPTHPPLRSSHSLQDMNMMQTAFGDIGTDDPYANQGMLTSQGMLAPAPEFRKRARRGQRSNRALAEKANDEYARFMDEINDESRNRGDTILAGDMLSGHAQAQVRFNLQPPSPLPKANTDEGIVLDDDDKKSQKVESEEQEAWSDLMQSPKSIPEHHLNPAVFDAGTASFMVPPKRGPHLLAATRPSTQSPQVPVLQDGRNSVPPRSRPVLLSPIDMLQRQGRVDTPLDIGAIRQRLTAESNLIFGEKPGSVSSRNPSPAPDGLRRSASTGRRLYEK